MPPTTTSTIIITISSSCDFRTLDNRNRFPSRENCSLEILVSHGRRNLSLMAPAQFLTLAFFLLILIEAYGVIQLLAHPCLLSEI
jgi:hypothetical protein